jgi:hypothetical protein
MRKDLSMRSPALLALPALLVPAALLAAACYRSSDAPPAPPATPAGPPPAIAWAEHNFQTTRLPAVSADGAAVLLGLEDNDGGRGNANFRFELRDRGDAKLATQSVLTVEEYDQIQDGSGGLRGMDARIDAANRWLAAQNTERRFAPLTELPVETGDAIASPFRATGQGVTIEWKDNRVTIAEGGKQLVARETPPTWYAPRRPRGSGGDVCENPAFLNNAWVSLPHKLAVLTIAYSGNDTCWEPSNAPHVVAW